jgi:hypothetical protein
LWHKNNYDNDNANNNNNNSNNNNNGARGSAGVNEQRYKLEGRGFMAR